MKVPKHYFQDRSVLALVGANVALFLLSSINVLLAVGADENPTNIVTYRDTPKVGQVSGPTSDLNQFAVFAFIVTCASIVLSMKLFAHRRHLAVGILGLNVLLLVMSIVIFNALTRTL